MPFQKGNQLSRLASHKSAGRKPELTQEEHAQVNRSWGEAVLAAARVVRDFVSAKANCICEVNMPSRDQVAVAMEILKNHFPSPVPEVVMEHKELDPHVLPAEVARWLTNPNNRLPNGHEWEKLSSDSDTPSERPDAQTVTLPTVLTPEITRKLIGDKKTLETNLQP